MTERGSWADENPGAPGQQGGDDLPTLESLRGAVPNLTGGMESVAWSKKRRAEMAASEQGEGTHPEVTESLDRPSRGDGPSPAPLDLSAKLFEIAGRLFDHGQTHKDPDMIADSWQLHGIAQQLRGNTPSEVTWLD